MTRHLVWPVICLAACGDGVGIDDTDTDDAVACDDGGFVDDYVVGLSHATADGAVEAILLDADPAPPDVGPNTLHLEIQRDGAPVTDGLVELRPWMPAHGHGTTPAVFPATHDGTAWIVGPVELFMPGLWELNVDVAPDAAAERETVLFRFCLEG